MAASQTEWAENARRVEALGYDTLLIPDHFDPHLFAPIPALMAAALATTTLRVGSIVFDNDFRHPAMLAKETATIDVLSDGRLEFGIGAGWKKQEYDQAGIPFDPPGMRVERMQEAVRIIKGLWGDGPLTFTGQHYTIQALENWPKPVQRPHPPIHIGAGRQAHALLRCPGGRHRRDHRPSNARRRDRYRQRQRGAPRGASWLGARGGR